MTEYNVRISLVVDARDHDEAVDIAKAIRASIENPLTLPHPYIVREVHSYTEAAR